MSPNVSERDLSAVRPYGDTYGDGMMQIGFSLPVPKGEQANEAARRLLLTMGFQECQIVHDRDLGEGFTHFVAYARTTTTVNYEDIEIPKADIVVYDRDTCDRLVRERLGRKVVVVGACTGSDAHTVGIDAIMNMKGYSGHYGLERYQMFDAHNLGSQIPNEELLRYAAAHKADALLISQVVTQKDTHLHNLSNFIELAESMNLRDRMLLIVGGPRITHQLALELGFDAGFGRDSYAEHVASFVVEQLPRRLAGQG